MTGRQLLIRIAIAVPVGLVLGIAVGMLLGSIEGVGSVYVIAPLALIGVVGFNAYRRQRQLNLKA